MEPLTILIWLVVFLLAVLLQAIVINGVWGAAKGESELLPNGKWKHSDMILYPIKRFLTRQKLEPINYRGDELKKLVNLIETQFGIVFPDAIEIRYNHINTEAVDIELVKKLCEKACDRFVGLNWVLHDIDGKVYGVSFFRNYKFYILSKWLRKPVIECVKCMPSYYSIVLFLPAAVYLLGWHWYLIPLYFINVFAVSYTANLIHKS